MSGPSPEIAPEIINNLRDNLSKVIKNEFENDDVCLLLSGGADSTLVGLSAHHLGKKIHAISYQMDGVVNPDCEAAENTCREMGWNFHRVVVPRENPTKWFFDLMSEYGCRKKTEIEVLYPFIFMIEKVKELGFDHILTGFGSLVPDDRRQFVGVSEDPQAYWDNYIENGGSISSATKRCIEFADSQSVLMSLPLTHPDFTQHLRTITIEQVRSPYPKAPYKRIYENDFFRLGLLKKKNRNLQHGGRIEDFFSVVLDNPEVNVPDYQNGTRTSRIVAVVNYWSKRLDQRPVGTHSNDGSETRVTTTDIKFSPYMMKDVWDKSDEKLFSVVTLFAGGGGSSTGYKLAGGDVLLANEFVPEAVKTYRYNYPYTPVAPVDIRKINKGIEYVEDLFNEYEIEIDSIDILDGSPPCSTFSTSGKGEEGILLKDVKYSDLTQDRIGMLIHDYVFFASCVRPKVCLIENVPEISNSHPFQVATDRLRHHGYKVNHQVLISSRFGVPQRRRRLFVVAVRGDVAEKVGIKSDEDILSLYPIGSDYEVSVREALDGVEIDQRERNFLLSSALRGVQYELVKALPKDPEKVMRMNNIDKNWTSDFNLGRLSWEKPSATLTATGCQIGLGGMFHPSEDRIFTIKELLRLQSLPDDFHLTGTFNQRAERIGRMVPPRMTQHLAQSIYEKVIRPFSG